MTHKLRIFHVSDLHAGKDDRLENWRRRTVLGDSWRKNLDELCADGVPCDLVCFTGDLAYSGRAAQYEQVAAFAQELCERLGVPVERFFCVPGNHDIDRAVAVDVWERVRKVDNAQLSALSRWLAGGESLREFNKTDRDALLSRQAGYRTALQRFGLVHLLPQHSPHGGLGFRREVVCRDLPFPVQVIGLDTSWLCGADSENGSPCATDDQVMLLASADGVKLPGFRLALMHHPLSWLRDERTVRRALSEHADLVLRGHLHDPTAELHSEPSASLRTFAAGCLYESERHPNSCQMIDVELDANGRPLSYTVRYRSWRSHWFDDNGVYPGSRDGRLRIDVVPRVAEDQPTHPRVAAFFVGRALELIILEQALLPSSGDTRAIVCAVQGMPGVGKSYLADRFVTQHSNAFPGGWIRIALTSSDTRPASALRDELAERLWLERGDMRATTEEQRDARRYAALRQRLLHPRTLLLLENVDGDAAARAVAELGSYLHGAALLVTGRWTALGSTAGWQQVQLQPFDEADALEQLRGEMAHAHFDNDDLQQLVQTLGFLPLAIHLAAGYLNRGYSAAEFLARLRSSGFATPPVDYADPLLAVDRSRAVLSATFQLSLTELRYIADSRGSDFESGLTGLAFAAPEGFGTSLGCALSGLAHHDFAELRSAALSLSLLEHSSCAEPTTRWHMHALLAEWLQHRSSPDIYFQRMTAWFDERITQPQDATARNTRDIQWAEVSKEVANLRIWLDMLDDRGFASRSLRMLAFAVACGPYDLWSERSDRVLRQSLDHTLHSDLLYFASVVHFGAGNYSRALDLATQGRAINLQRGAYGSASRASIVIADVHKVRAEFDEAIKILRTESIAGFERVGDTRARAYAIGIIANILEMQGDLREALRLRKCEALPVYELLGDTSLRLQELSQIAALTKSLGDLDEALRICNSDLVPALSRLGNSRELAIAYSITADVLSARGALDEAMRMRRDKELPVFERLGDHRSCAVTLGKIADILRAQGLLSEALRIYQCEVLPIYERLESFAYISDF